MLPSYRKYDQLHFAGHHSGALLRGLFQVSALHNIVHVLFGMAGIALARTVSSDCSFLLHGGFYYLVLFVYGLVILQDASGNFVPLNGFDSVLHLLFGFGMVALALALAKGHTNARAWD